MIYNTCNRPVYQGFCYILHPGKNVKEHKFLTINLLKFQQVFDIIISNEGFRSLYIPGGFPCTKRGIM